MIQVLLMIGAIVLTLPGVALRLLGIHIDPLLDSLIYGLTVVGAAFLLAWAAEVAQHDIPRSLALTVLALIAVLPEYAVDMYLAWRAAGDPTTYAPLALVNMTGANRLLIGIGWPVVVLIYCLRARRGGQPASGITLDPGQNTEILFLGLATLYSFLLPIKGTLDLIDVVVLVAIFGGYVWQVAQAEHIEPELIGPARVIGALPDMSRRLVAVLFFLIAGVAIYLVAEPFAEALIAAGIALGLDRRTLVQWLAPLASETPEFIITGVFAWRLLGAAALGALVSSKVNQWTLLVGTVPLVFNLASYVIGKPIPTALPLDRIQRDDLLLTSAQSAFAVAMLLGLHLSLWKAGLLTALFLIQFLIPETHTAVTVVYLVLSAFFIIRNRAHIADAIRSLGGTSSARTAQR
jgi:cation:H+ antiporter